ncbi:MAG: hypothetical protein AABX93_02890 [Nanoarchaeota archaeon]
MEKKKISKKVVKKISKKKKFEEKSDVKKIEKFEEKKKGVEESELEEDVEESVGMQTFFQQFPSIKSSPVLEKVAKVRETNLEQQIFNTEIKKENEEKRIINYGGEKSNYEIEKPRERSNFNYAETTATYDFAPDEKKKDAIDFNAPKQKWETNDRKNIGSMEKAGFDEIQNENRGKKYLTNRKYD